MFASNFPAEDEPCRNELYANFKSMVQDLSKDVQEGLFFRNAERFYKIEPAVYMKVTTKKAPSFYTKSARNFLTDMEDKDGNKKDPVTLLYMSGLGDSTNT